MSKRLTIEQIHAAFSDRGWTLLESEYHNNHTPMKCLCPKGHETTIIWINFKMDQGCKHCAGNQKFTYEQVAQYFEEQGCKLLSKTYKNSVTPVKFRCACGNTSSIDFGNFRLGRRCQKCGAEAAGAKMRYDHKTVKAYFADHDCELLEPEYKNNRTKLQYRCKCGNISEVTFSNFQKCPNCWECGKAKKSGDNCYKWIGNRNEAALRKKYRKMCGRLIHRALNGKAKNDHTYTLLGYTADELRQHIQSHSDYQGEDGMQVDHVFPIHAFMEHQIYDLKFINALPNLCPIYGKDNQSKGAKYDKEKFEKWKNNVKI